MTDTKKISGLVKTQFPSFYKDEGQFFIDFVSAYYDWMESKTYARKEYIKKHKSTLAIVYGSANVVGNNTSFDTNFSNGDMIAISRDEDDYEIFTINTISNSSFLVLSTDKLPSFAHINASYGNVHLAENPGYYVRRTQDVVDIDETTDDFIVFFKETYLKNIQFSSVTDTQTMIKNSLDLYRSKGTPRSVDLLFKATFGIPAEIYYPATDIFTLSSGEWTIPTYLELSLNEKSIEFVGKQINGIKSGATAFCDNIIRRNVNGKLLDVAYISAISGNFETGEKINATVGGIDIETAPFIIGSLNELTIIDGGSGFSIGDFVSVTSNNGVQGRARVANTTNSTGAIATTLIDGGYGFSAAANVYISESILQIEDLRANSTLVNTYFNEESFEKIYQPTANITYESGTGTFNTGDDIFTYHANGDVNGIGAILSIVSLNSTFGELTAKVLSGSMDEADIYTTANAITAAVNTYANTTAYANVIGNYSNVVLQISNITGTFTTGELITTPLVGNGSLSRVSNTLGSNGTMFVSNATGVYHYSNVITGQTSGATATIDKVDLQIGVIGTNNTFQILSNNYMYSEEWNVNGSITFISSGSGFNFSVSNNFLYPEYINYATDLLTTNATHFIPIALDAVAYGLSGDPAANLTSNTIENSLTSVNTEIGKIQTLINFSPGSNYNRLPIVVIKDNITSTYRIEDEQILDISNTTSSFSVGELITQESTGYRGFVKAANNSELRVQKTHFYTDNNVILTVNATTLISGEDTGATANVDFITANAFSPFIGRDAVIDSVASIVNGAITLLDVTDSGFGYLHNETVTFDNDGSAIANLYTHGTAAGYYRSEDGFASSNKKIHDGEYWQSHSYEVRAAATLDKYHDMLKQVVHVAGTKMFGNLVHTSTTSVTSKLTPNTGTNTVIST